jgi:hypothetical protein
MRWEMTEKPKGIGEEKEKQKQRRLVTSFIMSLVSGLVIGFAGVSSAIISGDPIGHIYSNSAIGPLPAIIMAIGWGIFVPVMLIRSHKIADEHENIAYLWSGTIGSYFFMTVTPIWWILNRASIVPPVDSMILLLIMMLISSIVLIWLKFR